MIKSASDLINYTQKHKSTYFAAQLYMAFYHGASTGSKEMYDEKQLLRFIIVYRIRAYLT